MATMVVANASVYLMCCAVLTFNKPIAVFSYYSIILMDDIERVTFQDITYFVMGFNSSINPLINILINMNVTNVH